MSHGNPFLCRDVFSTPEEAVNAVVRIHERGGVGQVSMSEVARELGCSRAAIHQAHRGKDAFLVSLVERFGYRWREWFGDVEGVIPVRLPVDDDRAGVATWESLCALAAGEARAGRQQAWAAVTRIVERERTMVAGALRQITGERAEREHVVGLVALAAGLRSAMTTPAEPLSLDLATGVLRSFWSDSLGLPLTDVNGAADRPPRRA